MPITNEHNISLPLSVWLLHDNYDYVNDENYISATSLLKSTKQIILSKRILLQDKSMDVADRIASSMGHAIHDSIQKAWEDPVGRSKALRLLGYPEHFTKRVEVNPETLTPDTIPIWIEQRTIKEINVDGTIYKIGGKFDFVADNHLFDFKSTSVFTYLKNSKDEDYQLQGSIYRWLKPELITKDHIYINFIFTDWQRFMARNNPDYPATKIIEHPVELLSPKETENWVIRKIRELKAYWNSPEEAIPDCNDKELWRSEPKYKYYSDPSKANDPKSRSTRNFDDLNEANAFMAEKGKGVIKTVPGEVKACSYCPAYDGCKQRERYDV